jgi:hypothetical protein
VVWSLRVASCTSLPRHPIDAQQIASPTFLRWLTEKPQFDGLNGYTGLEHQGQQTPTAQSRFGELGQGRGDRPGMQGTGSDSNSRRSNWF